MLALLERLLMRLLGHHQFMHAIGGGLCGIVNLPLMKRDEIDIERSELKAVIQGKAFIFDQNRKQRVIEENDPVYLGYVLRILPEQGRVECLLNKGGVSERYELAIRVGQPIQ